ncbi:MAG: DHA2 family efflux MFS transporter permease subunit [Acidobacteriota bacterium]
MTADNGNRKWFIALTTMLGTFIEVLDTSVANVALPHMRGTYAVGTDEITWVITSYLVANAVILPMTGWLGSYFSRKRVYILCLVLFTLASYGSGMAPTLGFLIAMRVLQGLAGGAMVPMSQAILLESFPKEEHGKAMAVFGVGAVFAPVLGPLVGGWITDNWSWPWIFYINVPVGLLAVALALVFIEDPPYLKRPEGRVDYPSFLFVAVGLGSLEVMLNRGERFDWFASGFIKFFGAAALLGLALFLWRSLTVDNPLVDLSLFRDRSFAASTALMFAAAFSLYGIFTFVPLFVQNLKGYTATWAGVVLTPGGLGTLVTIGAAGFLVGRVDNRALIAVGLLLQGWAAWRLAGATLEAGLPYFAGTLFLHGLGIGLFFVPLSAAMARNLPPEKMGLATALFNLMRNEGGSVGIALSSTLLSQRTQFHFLRLGEKVSGLDPSVREFLGGTGAALLGTSGLDPASSSQAAQGLLYGEVLRQATTQGFLDVFFALGLVLGVVFLLLFFLQGKAPGPSPAGTP